MNRLTLILLTGLMTAAGSAFAQMAAPSLVPGFTAVNPAVIQWGAPSRVGAGIVQVDSETVDSTGAVIDGSDADGLFAGLRLVGENLSFAVEMQNLEGNDNSGVEREISQFGVNGAFQLSDSIAFGLALERTGLEFRVPATGVSLEVDSNIMLVGTSLKFGEIFFLGGGIGREKIEQTIGAPPAPDTTGEVERDVQGFGIGIFDGEGVKWHLEYSVIRGDFAMPPVGFPIEEFEVNNLVVEVNFAGYMFGYYSTDEEKTDESTSPATVTEIDSKQVAMGWVPDQGPAVVLIVKRSEETKGGDFTEEDTAAVLLSYLF